MKTILPLLACALGCAAALPAGAQNMKPGLWELSNKLSSSDSQMNTAMAEMQKQLAGMPPEQRKAMQQMMERKGMQMNVGAGGALTTRMCMTKEMIQRKEFPVQEGDCKQKVTPMSGNRMKVAFSCTKPPASGEGELTLDSDTSYRAKMHVKGSDEGRQQVVDMDVTGKWLGADCGKLRPVNTP
ncbi:MAG: DUF3617 domain-containing protein [Xanthobacteraceae bacterium]